MLEFTNFAAMSLATLIVLATESFLVTGIVPFCVLSWRRVTAGGTVIDVDLHIETGLKWNAF